MKRSNDSIPNLSRLKRANSSLFSIATLLDDDNNVDSHLGGVQIEDKSSAILNSKVRTVSSAGDLRSSILGVDDDAPPDEEVASSCSSESDSSPNFAKKNLVTCQEIIDPVANSTVDSATAVCTNENKLNHDHRTGLVFESASNHYDRYKKLHKERPTRVTCVYDYLSQQKPEEDGRQSIFERCRLQESEAKDGDASAEDLFLEDDDYLRVHLPGYMQR
jgi:hypothetical protein